MREDGMRSWTTTDRRAAAAVAPCAAREDDMMNCNILTTNVVRRYGPGEGAAWVECARRSEVFQR